MYESFFGLDERPFDLTPNPRYLLLTPTHREALANLEHGLMTGKGLTLLLGEAGTGKTTLLRRALSTRPEAGAASYVYLNNPMLTRQEFYELLATHFSLGADAATSKARFVSAFERGLRQQGDGPAPVLIIDEAQSLPDELLEEIRLLANIETDTQKLLLLVLAGQPELAGRLNDPALRQLKQRVALRCELTSLSLAETASYIAGRIQIAGGSPGAIFSKEAVIAVHEYSRGIPRTISVICDNALVTAFAAGQRPADASVIRGVARDFDLAYPLRPGTRSSPVIEDQAVPTSTSGARTAAARSPILSWPRWISRRQETA